MPPINCDGEPVVVHIPWKLKSAAFSVIDTASAHKALYFLQKNATKRSRIVQVEINPLWQAHADALLQHRATGKVFEFGAGKTLGQNLFLGTVVDRQIVVDINPMLDIELVEKTRDQLSRLVTLRASSPIVEADDLDAYGIRYRAPYDAGTTDFPNGSLDACVSTNTLEHIPGDTIRKIFTELRRTLKPNGIVSARIDYSDHYAHTDRSISLLNYLRFSEKKWARYNHRCHHQNRMRHYDYVRIFNECGFVVLDEKLDYAATDVPASVTDAFKDKPDSWAATSGHLVLRKLLH